MTFSKGQKVRGPAGLVSDVCAVSVWCSLANAGGRGAQHISLLLLAAQMNAAAAKNSRVVMGAAVKMKMGGGSLQWFLRKPGCAALRRMRQWGKPERESIRECDLGLKTQSETPFNESENDTQKLSFGCF